MKIVDIVSPPRHGGTFTWARDVAAALSDTHVVQARHIHKIVDVITYPLYSHVSNIVHSVLPYPFLFSRTSKYILALHGDFTIEKNFWSPLYPVALRRADAVTVPSQYLQNQLSLSAATVIPNGLFVDKYCFDPSHAEVDDTHRAIMTVSNFAIYQKCKGVIEAARAVRIAADREGSRSFTLTVLGEGRFRRHIEKESMQYMRDNYTIRFVGYQPLLPYFQHNSIFLYYSFLDSFGITLLEAMASGVAVVTNDFGPTREIITDKKDGYIFDNVESAAEVIQNVRINRILLENARATVENRFNIRLLTDRYKQLYNTL